MIQLPLNETEWRKELEHWDELTIAGIKVVFVPELYPDPRQGEVYGDDEGSEDYRACSGCIFDSPMFDGRNKYNLFNEAAGAWHCLIALHTRDSMERSVCGYKNGIYVQPEAVPIHRLYWSKRRITEATK